jgi:hypothetical protein
MKCVDLQEKVQGGWVRVESGGGKVEEVGQIHSKDTASLYSIRFNCARKENPFVSW